MRLTSSYIDRDQGYACHKICKKIYLVFNQFQSRSVWNKSTDTSLVELDCIKLSTKGMLNNCNNTTSGKYKKDRDDLYFCVKTLEN